MVGGVPDEVAPGVERAVEVRPLRHDAEHGARPDGVRRDVDAGDGGEPEVLVTRVVSTPTVVVLPAPFGPSSPNTSPRRTAKLSPSTAGVVLRP